MRAPALLLSGAATCLLLAGVVFGSTLDAATPKATNETAPLNNSVVAAAAAAPKDETTTVKTPPCANCNQEPASSSADPGAKVNQIDKSTAELIADEYGEQFKSDFEETRVSPSSVDERLRQLSEEVHKGFHSNNKFFADLSSASSAASAILPSAPSFEVVRSTFSDPVFAGAAARDEWTPIHSFHTPGLPGDFEMGFVSKVVYDHHAEPNKFVRTSVAYVDDGVQTGYVSTSNFKYDRPLSVQPTTVTLSVSSSGSYDINEKGSYSQEPEEEPKQESELNSDVVETVITMNGTTLLNDTATSSTSNNVTLAKEYHSVKNLSTLVPAAGAAGAQVTDVELVPSGEASAEASRKALKAVTNSRQNEALERNASAPLAKDLDESMSGHSVAVSGLAERRGKVPAEPEPTTESLQSNRLDERPVTPKGLPTTTARTRKPSTGYRRRTTTTSTTSTTTTTEPPEVTTLVPAVDSVGSESTFDCTTPEEEEELTTVEPTTDKKIVTHHSTTTTTTVSKYASTEPTRGRSRIKPRPTVTSSEMPMEETTYTMRSESSTVQNVRHNSVETTVDPANEEPMEDEDEDCDPDDSSSTPAAAVPGVPGVQDEATDIPMEVKAYLQLRVASSWDELCGAQDEFKRGLADIVSRGAKRDVSPDRVVLLNDHECLEPEAARDAEEADGISVHLYLQDEAGGYDQELTQAFTTLWGEQMPNNTLKISCAELKFAHNGQLPSTSENGSVIAAIAITGVAAGCFILLIILMLVMRKRSKRYNYGQRCTPVSLDAYSLDSVSVYNSVRRKALRASKRSYGNPNFEDGESPSHQMNFAGLANCLNDTKAIHEEFALVPVVHARLDELPPGAETKNRYANVIPLPETRVPLTKRGSDPLSEYVNANFVRGPKNAPRYYIACQAPMENTVSDFWRMIWEQQSKVVIMLTDLEENGVEKCADYLPPSEVLDCHRLFGDFHVTLKKREERDKYVISTLQLKNMETNLWREVTHLWYFGWPSSGVPSEANSVIALVIEARGLMKNNPGPSVVHCSPGTGRTGTVLAVDLCVRDFEKSRLVDIPKIVHRLRRDRAGAVQTKEQYLFIYQVLNLYAAKLTGGAMESF